PSGFLTGSRHVVVKCGDRVHLQCGCNSTPGILVAKNCRSTLPLVDSGDCLGDQPCRQRLINIVGRRQTSKRLVSLAPCLPRLKDAVCKCLSQRAQYWARSTPSRPKCLVSSPLDEGRCHKHGQPSYANQRTD